MKNDRKLASVDESYCLFAIIVEGLRSLAAVNFGLVVSTMETVWDFYYLDYLRGFSVILGP